MARDLPTVNIKGTDFIIDVDKIELREKSNPTNTISFFDMTDYGDNYEFAYGLQSKNIPNIFSNEPMVLVGLDEMVKLDPVGMAEKYRCKVEDIHLKSDFELMVDQEAYEKRKMGILPTIAIAGYTFFVDIRMGMLRPLNDFASTGIVFKQIGTYYQDDKETYLIPYNPATRSFQEFNYHGITEYTKDVIAIEFPHEKFLDPIGYNNLIGLPEKSRLKELNLKSHFVASVIPWKQTPLEDIIQDNKKKQEGQKSVSHQKSDEEKVNKRNKGPRL